MTSAGSDADRGQGEQAGDFPNEGLFLLEQARQVALQRCEGRLRLAHRSLGPLLGLGSPLLALGLLLLRLSVRGGAY